MKLSSIFAALTLSLALVLAVNNADAARRLGGGRSIGQQSSNVSKRESAVHPAQNSANANAQKPGNGNGAPAQTPPAAAPSAKPAWGGMLGGLAAGLGLAWLAHSMGLGGAAGGGLMTLLLLGLMAFVVFTLLKRRSNAAAYGNASSATATPYATTQYSPQNVGNDSAARPFERLSPVGTGSEPSIIGSGIGAGASTGLGSAALSGTQTWGVPSDFDAAGFLAAAKAHYIALQAAWDKADQDKLRSLLTEEMMVEIRQQLAERPVDSVQHNEIVSLEAQLLGIEELAATRHYMASVEFSGTIREQAHLSPEPFREVWNLTKPVAGGGWLVAGIQTLS